MERVRVIPLKWLAVAIEFGFICSLVLGLRPSYLMAQDLSHMGIQELISLDITSVSKKEEQASKAAAAVFVITNEDIRRSGATTLRDVFRLAPGVHVAKTGSQSTTVGIRSFNGNSAGLVLVMIDGRPLYDPEFSGVFWPNQDTLLEDIERVEVIRGPGATMWGVNAVNGVINIITKNSQDTQGLLAYGGGGSYETGFGGLRYGSEICENTFLRTWVKGFRRDEFDSPVGGGGQGDDWWSIRPGFRLDSDLNEDDKITLDADFMISEAGNDPNFDPVVEEFLLANGGNTDSTDNSRRDAFVRGNWTRSLGDESFFMIQSFYQYVYREVPFAEPERNSFSIRAEHRLPIAEIHDVMWGLEYRLHHGNWGNEPTSIMEPESDTYDLFAGLLQDEIALVEDEVSLTLGIKLSNNEYSDFEWQPQARLAWTPEEETTVWGAISRAVRIPGRVDHQLTTTVRGIDTPGGRTLVVFRGDSGSDSMTMISYEAGVRKLIAENLYLDVAGFFFDYDDVLSAERGTPTPVNDPAFSYLEIPVSLSNNLSSEVYGVDFSLDYRPIEEMRFVATYSYVENNTFGSSTTDQCGGGVSDTPLFCLFGESVPNHMFSIRSSNNLPYDLTLDAFFQFIESFDSQQATMAKIEQQEILDVRLAWQATDEVELSVVGQNLMDNNHVEWIQGFAGAGSGLVPRGVYGRVKYEM